MSGMSIWEILLLGVGLSMDAFAVSICKGLSVKKVKWQHLLCVGAYFGIFQALMPTLGYFLGTTFSNLIVQFDDWMAFILLAIIGVNMVSEALSKDHPVHEYFEQREINLLKEYAFAAKRDGVADPERTALQVLSAMEGLQLRWLNGSHDVDFIGEWKAIIDLLIP